MRRGWAEGNTVLPSPFLTEGFVDLRVLEEDYMLSVARYVSPRSVFACLRRKAYRD